ncbi:MAG: hypothetical protein J5954_05645, partial [Prevotella sp.]|nr:hypothetical protein [Prevotella sp.]
MKQKQLKLFLGLFMALLAMSQNALADFKDFAVDLTNGNLLEESEKVQWGTINAFGIAVDAEGKVSRVAADAETAVAVLSGKWHSATCWASLSVTVKVDGPVKVTCGTQPWDNKAVTIMNGSETVASFSNKGTLWTSSAPENVVSGYYKGAEATTLTIDGGGYPTYIAIATANPSELKTEATVSFALGDATGFAPASIKDEVGKSITLPKNYTMYVEGKTLTAWSDGTNSYAPGTEFVVPEADIELQPVFTDNTVSLTDRTEPVTLKWNFRRDLGAPIVQWQNRKGDVWVAQAVIGDKAIDVPMTVNTNLGKFNNANNNDWIQTNIGTSFTIPACKGATVSMEGYAEFSTTTIDGQTDYTSGKTVNYELAGNSETIDIVIGTSPSNSNKSDCQYMRYIQILLPVIQSAGGESFDNADASVEWPMLDNGNVSLESKTVSPESAISVASLEYTPADATISTGSRSKDPDNGLKFVTFKGNNVKLHWNVKPTKGLTFTPTQIKMYVQRFATNKENGVVVSAKVGDGEETSFGTYTARRANWDDAEEKKQFKWDAIPATLVNEIVIDLTAEQQTALTSGDGFDLYATTGLAADKAGGFSDVRVYGKVNGTIVDVEKYTLATIASPEAGGSVTKYPNADEYEDGTEVTLTATENFGYDFVNWTNAAGEEVSTEAKFKYTVTANET